MKLDLEYIRRILSVIEDDDNERVEIRDLMKSLELSEDELDRAKSFVHHINILKEIYCIESDIDGEEFQYVGSGRLNSIRICYYSITMEGHKLLDCMRNDTVWKKLQDEVKVISIDTLRQLPALAIQLILTGSI